MMKKIILLLILCPLFGMSCDQKKIENSYILFQYKGDSDKPIPAFVFYLGDKFNMASIEYGRAFKIVKKDFSAVENIVTKNSVIVHENKRIYAEFVIAKGNSKHSYIVLNKTETLNILIPTASHMATGSKGSEISQFLQNIIQRLPEINYEK